jgi:hypothetical protein
MHPINHTDQSTNPPNPIHNNIHNSEAAFAFTVFCGMLKDVASFREAVNNAMTVDDLRRALVIHQVSFLA